MENGVEMYKDKPLKAKLPHNIVFILIIVLTNIVALLIFSSFCNISFHKNHTVQPSSTTSDPLRHASFDLNSEQMIFELNESRNNMLAVADELLQMRMEIHHLREQSELVTMQMAELMRASPGVRHRVHNQGTVNQLVEPGDEENPWSFWSRGVMNRELDEYTRERKLPMGWNPALNSETIVAPVGHACALLREELEKFMNYEVGKDCPDDEALAQRLLLGGCEPLPRRRCFASRPSNFTEPVPYPYSLWTIPEDNNILWTAHPCKSFECLNERAQKKVFADCLDCFDLDGREKHRWMGAGSDLDFTIEEVIGMKPQGTIKIGLDIGGGTGSFAARMREVDVTIVTSTLNLNGPFNNFIAHRGLVPLFLTVSQRFPFMDNTLDIVHSMHVLSNWIPTESLEFILYDIDRVLRPGGLFWLDHFFCIEDQLETYIPMIEKFGYVKLKWTVGRKLDRGPELKERYISALLEKPRGPA